MASDHVVFCVWLLLLTSSPLLIVFTLALSPGARELGFALQVQADGITIPDLLLMGNFAQRVSTSGKPLPGISPHTLLRFDVRQIMVEVAACPLSNHVISSRCELPGPWSSHLQERMV